MGTRRFNCFAKSNNVAGNARHLFFAIRDMQSPPQGCKRARSPKHALRARRVWLMGKACEQVWP